MKKLGVILTWIGLAAWFLIMLSFVAAESEEALCTRINIRFSDTLNARFITREDVRALLDQPKYQLQGYALSGINTMEIEQELEQDPYIRNAEVSKDMSGRLDIEIEQRIPLVRICPDRGEGYYLDEEGSILPLSDQYTPLILVVSGNLPSPDEALEQNRRWKELFHFCSFLNSHDLWQHQIVQVYRDQNGEIELFPMVGAHQIIFGSLDQWEEKLDNLELLYRKGLSRYGWNTYSTINLKYSNQVICTKR